MDANLRYPDQLSKLESCRNPIGRARSVVNAGIGGNRWFHGGLGPAAADRLARDALKVTGVREIVIMMGINDIGFGVFSEDEAVTLDQLTTSIAGAVTQARAAGLRVIVGTLPPFGESLYYTEEGDTMRQELNTWIRANNDMDGFVDFDQMLRDSANVKMLDAHYDSGDHHPNDAGYAVMAELANVALQRVICRWVSLESSWADDG